MAEDADERDTTRLEAFSDGVFAFGITLLVLDLKVPNGTDIATQLRSELPAFGAMALTFATLYVLWMNHHALLRRARHVDGALLYANGFLLFFVTIAAYPTALLAEFLRHPEARLAAAFYAAWLLLVNVAFNALVAALGQVHHRHVHGFGDAELKILKRRMQGGFVAYAVALAVAVWAPWVTVAICLGSWAYWLWRGLVAHRHPT